MGLDHDREDNGIEAKSYPVGIALERVSYRRWYGLLSAAFVAALVLSTLSISTLSLLPSIIARKHGNVNLAHSANDEGARTLNVLDNGRTSEVQWDGYSLSLRGQRVFLHSGELHPFRLPVPALWPDVLDKFAAAGLNAVSIYVHWGLTNPSPGVIDFDSYRALAPFYAAAQERGLWVVVRPGPYINAETTAGGIAHWVTSEVKGGLRTNESDYFESWRDYIGGIIEETKEWQITKGGPVIAVQIDNEYEENNITVPYMQALEDAFRTSELVVPLTYNDPNERVSFVNGTGSADIYGLDGYPQRFDCSNPETWFSVDSSYHDYHSRVNPHQPFYSPEFQGGAYDAWGPTAPGYAKCAELTGPAFMSVFYKSLWASNAKMINYYMVYGGTSWGGLPFPGVYTSYDYGSAITEARTLNEKYTELKLQSLFLRSTPAFAKTDVVGNSSTSSGGVRVSNDQVLVVWLRNPDTRAGFWIARQDDSTSKKETVFNLTVETSGGTFDIPQTVPGITLGGREAKTIVTDYTYGETGFLRWSTAEILFAGRIGTRDVLLAYANASQSHELATETQIYSFPTLESPSSRPPFAVVQSTSSSLILFAEKQAASTVFAPVLPGAADDPLAHMWGIGTNTSVLIAGPYLVRGASLSADGRTLALRGDLDKDTLLRILAVPTSVRHVSWNGGKVHLRKSGMANDVWEAPLEVSKEVREVSVPALKRWRYADSLPEKEKDYDDERWVVADKTSSNVFLPMKYGDGRTLFGCDYGFCENTVLWRGHFEATGEEKSVNLLINGGEAFAASVFLNGIFLDTAYGNSTNNKNIIPEVDKEYVFPEGALIANGDNVITIIQDNMGLDESGESVDEIKSPRGVRGFQLNPSGNFSVWKVQGKVGGYTDFPDRTRGIFNEGGLFGERAGWHLPGFDTSGWIARDLSAGLPSDAPGVGFFVTTFELDIPKSLDVMISFNFDGNSDTTDSPYRALLFVNGWMMGKRVGNLGPQTKFPVHEGILDYNGVNTVAIGLWAMEPSAIRPTLELSADAILDGGVGRIQPHNPTFTAQRSAQAGTGRL